MKPATPLPWHVYQSPVTPYPSLFDVVGETRDDDVAENVNEENARYILRACNAYPKLVEALKNAESGLDLAYHALEKGCYDEAFLHIGHHASRIHIVLRELGELE